MCKLVSDFREIRRTGTPWIIVNTPDYRTAIKTMSEVRLSDEEDVDVPLIRWDIATGHAGLSKTGKLVASKMGDKDATVQAPSLFLKLALDAATQGTILFMVVSDGDMLKDATVAQAIANIRDEFKADRRTLVILGRGLKMPALVAEDVPIHNEPLPTEEQIKASVTTVYETQGRKPTEAELDKALTFLRGMTTFAVESAAACKLRKAGLDLAGLRSVQKEVIQASTNNALQFDTAKSKFENVGGQAAIRTYFQRLFAGPKAPRVVVRIDEIEKSISAGAMGGIASDNTGVSQDQLKTLLTAMEDNRWGGALLLGGPGTGKTLLTTCVGNEFDVLSLVGDLGATKASLVGESEQRIRRLVDVLKSLGGDRVCILGTCNKLGVMPPELLRRFNHGIWYFEVPTKAERKLIWDIQIKAFDLEEQKLPDDTDWVGSDIRNCCEKTWMLNCSLVEAADYITVSGRVSMPDIVQLRKLAEESQFRSASVKGPYVQNVKEVKSLRSIMVEDAVDNLVKAKRKEQKQ